MTKKKILIIDDETDFCKLVKRNLELISDYEVSIAGDGKKGFKSAKEFKPHLILLDIMMPGIDGLEVLKKLKSDSETTSSVVIMLTARGDDELKIKAAQSYCEDYITKPIDAPELKIKIEETLKRNGIK